MNKENASYLWNSILKAGDYLKDKLPSHPSHPQGRNAYAHIALCIKQKFKMSYKEINDEKLEEVLNYIEFLKNNPS